MAAVSYTALYKEHKKACLFTFREHGAAIDQIMAFLQAKKTNTLMGESLYYTSLAG
jgi:hypothetical protein